MTTASERLEPSTTDSTLSLTDVLTVIAWRNQLVDEAEGAVRTASDEALLWYVPSVGTIGMVMAHRFATYAAIGPSTWPVEDIARTFGIGMSPGRVVHTLRRLEQFGIARCQNHTLSVRLWLAPLTTKQRAQLPAYLAHSYPH